jgi:hypothetical protein
MFVPQKKLNTLLCHYVLGASSALLLCIIYIFRSLDQVWLRRGGGAGLGLSTVATLVYAQKTRMYSLQQYVQAATV